MPAKMVRTIKSLHLGKSPGPDGLSNDYYKQFQHLLCLTLAKLFSTAGSATSFSSKILKVWKGAYHIGQFQANFFAQH